MRLAALYDIHGNLPALEAVLQEVSQAAVDRIVVGGDVVYGPMSREVLACLLSLECPVDFIQGNAEVSVLAEMTGAAQKYPLPAPVQDIVRWEATQLREYQAVLATWPMTVRNHLPGFGDVLFCHATPRDENEIFVETTPETVLQPIFDVGAGLVVCGHTHMQFDRMIGRVRLVNAGSVGMPFGVPGAYWVLLGPEIKVRHTRYDLESAAARIRETSYPQAEEFAATSVLRPHAASDMLERFTTVALK